MKRLRQAYRFLTKDSHSNKRPVVSQGDIYGDVDDEWGISPYHFQTIPPPREEVSKGSPLRQMRSMPFFSREARASTDDLPAAGPSSRLMPTSRHTRKTSKVTQILSMAGASRDDVNVVDLTPNLFSPPVLPMEVDPFSKGPPIVSNRTPAIQVQPEVPATHPPAPQHVFRPALSMSSLSVPKERSTTQAHASQSTSSFHADTAPHRAPRPLHRAGYSMAATLPARSHSNPPPPTSCVPDHYTNSSSSRPPHRSGAVKLASKSQHNLISTHYTQLGGTIAPLARDVAVKHHEGYQNLNLRKARSSIILSNAPPLPLHAPKPFNAWEKSSVETLLILTDSASAERGLQNQIGITAAPRAVWPPAPVLRPLRIANEALPPPPPPRKEERDAFRAVAIEAERVHRTIRDERAHVERVRGDRNHNREVRRGERDAERQRSRHHKRAATEGSRRRQREVEYRTMADYGYFPTDQNWAGAASGAW
ncbi:hypothetical protein BC827DRAFT_1228951 [Russula dissimulans]|nr:hypothetical protein BC827DRAFT_1228951 [Russula dissimulans]